MRREASTTGDTTAPPSTLSLPSSSFPLRHQPPQLHTLVPIHAYSLSSTSSSAHRPASHQSTRAARRRQGGRGLASHHLALLPSRVPFHVCTSCSYPGASSRCTGIDHTFSSSRSKGKKRKRKARSFVATLPFQREDFSPGHFELLSLSSLCRLYAMNRLLQQARSSSSISRRVLELL